MLTYSTIRHTLPAISSSLFVLLFVKVYMYHSLVKVYYANTVIIAWIQNHKIHYMPTLTFCKMRNEHLLKEDPYCV